MTHLEHCLGKVSKLIDKADADLLQKQAAAYEAEGMKPIKAATAAARRALDAVNKDYASTLKATRKTSPKTVPLLEAYWKGEPLSVNELPKAHVKLAQQLMEAGVNSEAELSNVLKGESAVWVKPFAEWMLKNKVEPPTAPEPVTPNKPEPTPEVKAEPVAKKPAPKLPPKIQRPGLIGPRKSIMEEISREHDLGVIGAKPQGFTEEQLAKDALADLAEAKEFDLMSAEEQSKVKEPPRVGPALVSYLLDNLDIQAAPKDTMLLTYEAAKTVKEIKALRVRMAKEGSSITDDDIETKREYLRQVRDLLAYRGSRAGSALRAYRNIVNEQFEPEIMASDYYGWKNQGKPKSEWVPVSKEEQTSIEKESAEIKDALAKLEKEETAHKASIAKQEQLQQENLQLKGQLAASKKPRKAPERKSTSENQAQRSQSAREKLMTFSVTFKTTGKGPSTLDRMADNARRRIKAQSSRTSAGVDPTILLDVTIIAAQYIKNGITKLVEVTAQLVKDLGEDYRKYAEPAFNKANESVNSTVDEDSILELLTDVAADYSLNGLSDEQIKEKLLEEFGDTFKSLLDGVIEGIKPRITKTAAGSRKKSPQELASLIDPNEKLSRQMVYNMAGGLLPKFRGDALINEILRLIQPSLPHVTFHNVQDAYTGYGKAKFPSKEELATLQRKERRLQLLNRQIGVVLQGQLPELTGRQQDRLDPNNEDDQKIRRMIAERNQLMKDLKIPEDSAKRNLMREALSAIKTRYRNDLAELQTAIDTRTALVEKKKQDPQTDQELTELKAQKKAKRAEYNAAFGIKTRQLSLEQRLTAADKALDKSLALEEKMELEGILKRPTKPGLPQTVEMKAKAAQIKAKRDARHAETRRLAREAKELLNPPKTDTEKWNESQAKALEKTIERFDHYLKHGKYPDKTPGVAYTRDQIVADLLTTKNELKAQVAAVQKDKRRKTPDVREALRKKSLLKSLNKITVLLQEQVKANDPGKIKTKKEQDADVKAILEINKGLREAITKLRKADPNWVASYEAKLNDTLIKASEARTAKWEQRLRDGDFSEPTKIQREPSKELDVARFKADKAKRGWLEKRQQFNAKRAPASEKVTKLTQAFWELMGAFNLGFDIAAGRQGLLPTLTNPKLARVWFTVLKNSTEQGEHAHYERLSDPRRSPVAFYMKKFKNNQYKLYSPHDHLTFGKEDIPRPELLAAFHNYIKNNKWLRTIPGAATTLSTPTGLLIRLERANRMAHNILSDALAAQQLGKNRLSGSKEVTKSDVDLAANMAMVGVRRGSFRNEQVEKGFPLVNLFFISGRYLTSGLQYATGQPVWTARGGYRGTFKMRARVAWNLYGRVLLSTSALAYVLGQAAYGDDEEKWKRYINPLDNRFMVLEFNGVEYNFLKAITPYVSIIAKLVMGYKVTDGKIVPLRGQGAQWGRTLEDEWGVFLKNRRSLRLGLVADIVKQKHYDGSEVTGWSVMKKMSTNINISNDLKILESEQVPAVQKALSITTIHLSLDAQMKRAEKERRSSKSSMKKLTIKPLSTQK